MRRHHQGLWRLHLCLLLYLLSYAASAQVPPELVRAIHGNHPTITVEEAIGEIVARRDYNGGKVLARSIFFPQRRVQKIVETFPRKPIPVEEITHCGNDPNELEGMKRHEELRKSLILGLEELGTQSLLQALAVAEQSYQALENGQVGYDSDFEIRLVRVLEKSNSDETKLALMRLETNCSKAGRFRSATHCVLLGVMARRYPDVALPRLSIALRNRDEFRLKAAVLALWHMEQNEASQILLSFAPKVRTNQRLWPVTRRRLWHVTLRALGEREVGPAIPEFLLALSNQNKIEREIAARYLGRLKDPRCFQPLLKALTDPEPAVRLRAAKSLGDLGNPQAIPALKKALKDPHKAVRLNARMALKKFD